MKEWEEVQILFADNKKPEEICVLRTEYAMRWYIRKACQNKRFYYTFSLIGMLSPLINAVLVVCGDYRVATVVLSSITSLAASLLAVTNARQKWENYRTAAEFLKREFTLFQARTGVYGGEKRTEAYLYAIEESMQKTHMNWQKIFDKEEKEDKEEAEEEME